MATKSGTKRVITQLKCAAESAQMMDPNHVTVNFDDSAVVFSTAVLEYLVTEILILASNASESQVTGPIRIGPRHLQLAIKGDEELDKLLSQTIGGGRYALDNYSESPV